MSGKETTSELAANDSRADVLTSQHFGRSRGQLTLERPRHRPIHDFPLRAASLLTH